MKFCCKYCHAVIYVKAPTLKRVICGHCANNINVPEKRYGITAILGDDYIILEHIGTGGMGLVFKARQISQERIVAIKVLKESFAEDENFVKKFFGEARAAGLLQHDNIVQSYAIGHDDGLYFIVMEFVNGNTLGEMLIKNYSFSEQETIEAGISMATALDYAWEEKLILHRDVKPDNIMIDAEGSYKLMDLGLSCTYHDLTSHEDVIGTPQYISPDQLLSPDLMDFRGDQYSLGATLYHMVTGQFPFDSEDAAETAMMHIQDDLQSPCQLAKEISPAFSQVICKMMGKTPDLRYQDTKVLIQDLKSCLAGI